jgi:hypothetical protein
LAKTLTNIASLASIYVPLRIPPTTLPGYLKVDRSSLWHNSALVSTAIETSSIPTRFHIVGGLKTIDGLAGFLNMGSGQNIAMLSMSIGDDVGKGKKKMSSERVNCSWGRDSKDRKAEHFFAVSNVSRGFDSDENEDGADRPDQSTTDRHAIVFDRWVNTTSHTYLLITTYCNARKNNWHPLGISPHSRLLAGVVSNFFLWMCRTKENNMHNSDE